MNQSSNPSAMRSSIGELCNIVESHSDLHDVQVLLGIQYAGVVQPFYGWCSVPVCEL